MYSDNNNIKKLNIMTITQLSNQLNADNLSISELQSLLISAKRFVNKIEGAIEDKEVQVEEVDEILEAQITVNTLGPSLSDATDEQRRDYYEALDLIAL